MGFAIALVPFVLVVGTCDVVTRGTATEECADEGFGIVLIGGAVGGALGAGIGALIRGPERWEDIAFGGVDPTFSPIFNLRLDRGHPAAVLGARLRL